MKNREQLAEEYAEEKSSSEVFKRAHIADFLAGYDAAIEKVKEYLFNTEQHNDKDSVFYISKEYLKQTIKFLSDEN